MSSSEPSQNLLTEPSAESSERKPLLSERKIQANRRNALPQPPVQGAPAYCRGRRRESGRVSWLGRKTCANITDPLVSSRKCSSKGLQTCWWRLARVIRAENG